MALGRIDHFDLIRPLGRGGMGDVYLAHDTHLDCDVALKVLRGERAGDVTYRARLLAEARALARLDHPNVVGILGCGEAVPDPPDLFWPGDPAPHPGSVVYLAMRHVEGSDLRSAIAKGALPLATALDWARQILSGLEAAHSHGVVHRDLKPANIRVTPAGELKLLDFGLADSRRAEVDSVDGTQTASREYVLGTIGYTCPEQWDTSGRADPRGDLFSAGVILYEMVTGRRPFQGNSMMEVLKEIATRDPTPMRDIVRGVPESLARATARLLHKDPAQRHASAREALADLDAVELPPGASRLRGRMPGGAGLRVLFRHRPVSVAATLVAAVLSGIGLLRGLGWGAPETVAVAGIENQTGDPRFDLQAAGLSADLATTLAQECRINVVESRLVNASRQPNRSPVELGREYGAGTVLLGTMHTAAGPAADSRLSLHVSAVRVRDQVTRWTREWDVAPDAISDLRRGMLQAVVEHWPRARGSGTNAFEAAVGGRVAADESYLRGLGYLASGDPLVRDSSVAEFDRALAIEPGFARALAGRARAQLAGCLWDHDTTRLVLAEADARRAIALSPSETDGRLALAQILQQRGRTPEAVDLLRGVIAANEQNAETFKLLGAAYAKLGEMAEARRSYRAALELQPSGPRVWRSYGIFLLSKAGDARAAEQAFRREIDLSPEDNKGYEDLAAALTQQCRYEAAVAAYARRPEPDAKSLQMLGNRGVALFFAGDYSGALSDFMGAVKFAPDNGASRMNLADAYLQLGRRSDALREYREARRLLERDVVAQPDDVSLRAQLALSLAKSGDLAPALREIERCEAAGPELHADAMHALAKALALCGQRDRSLAAIQSLLQGHRDFRCRLRAEPEFARLHAEPRFRALVAGVAD